MELLNISIMFILITILILLIVAFVLANLNRYTDLYLENAFLDVLAFIMFLFSILFILALIRIAIALL